MVARLTRDLPAYLRTPMTLDEAGRRVRHGLAHRERRFLDLVDRTVYRHAASPYRRLLEHAGCERGDLADLVTREGLEGALEALADRGVYVTYDELKGRRPAVRGSARFTFSARDFDNPILKPHYVVFTSGSGGTPSRVRQSLAYTADGATTVALAFDAHGIRNPRNLFWFGPLVTWPLVHLMLGQPIEAWFSPVPSLPPLAQAALRSMSLLIRASGRRLPMPRFRDLQEPERVTAWLLDHADAERPVVVNLRTSSAVRVARAAQALGRPLDGVTLHCRGEPLSLARRRHIEQAGARVLTSYASVELPFVAYLCPLGAEADDLHLCLNRYAAIGHERPIFEGGPSVESLLLTSLNGTVAKIALNTELGDSARIEQRACGCSLGALGLRTHLSEIRSFEKLSSEGTTFARGDVLAILEEILPARFGGSAVDYQLVEEEDAEGASRLILRVHPNVGPIDEAAMRAALLEALGRGGPVDAYQAGLLSRAGSIVVRRLPPLATRAGKVLPFQLLRTAGRT